MRRAAWYRAWHEARSRRRDGDWGWFAHKGQLYPGLLGMACRLLEVRAHPPAEQLPLLHRAVAAHQAGKFQLSAYLRGLATRRAA